MSESKTQAHTTSGCTASRGATRCRRRSRGSMRSCARSSRRRCRFASAAGRVLAAPIVSDVDVPGFDRATMDGYAVRGRRAPKAPRRTTAIPLTVVGDALPGVAVRRGARARRGRAHHDRRADARRQRCRPARRIRGHERRRATALWRPAYPAVPNRPWRRSRRSRRARTSAAAAKTSSPARRCSKLAACCGRRMSA